MMTMLMIFWTFAHAVAFARMGKGSQPMRVGRMVLHPTNNRTSIIASQAKE
jgi:hypothetical protein